MHFSDRDPMDIPPPPTIDEVAATFSVAIVSLVAQASLTEAGVGTVGSSSNGGPMVLDSVSISYTLWRNPDDREDPVNLAVLDDSMREALENPPVRPLPAWLMAQRELMRFPTLWEAVMTTRARADGWRTPESTLVGHVNNVLTNSFREQRVVGGFPGELDSSVSERHIEHAAVQIDGRSVPGMRIDTDPHIFALGADLGDRIVTAVVPRDDLPRLTLAFATR